MYPARWSRVGVSGPCGVRGLVEYAPFHKHIAVTVGSIFLEKTGVALAPPKHLAVGIASAIGRGRLPHQEEVVLGADFRGGAAEVDREFSALFASVVKFLPPHGRTNVIGGARRGSWLRGFGRRGRGLLGPGNSGCP